MHQNKIALCFALLISHAACSPQVADNEFRFDNSNPAFTLNTGPRVCIDEAHHNFHTVDGRYKPFATLLEEDGYQLSGFNSKFSVNRLNNNCDILVIANALGAQNKNNWNYPHYPAFSGGEIEAIVSWVRGGGRLMLIADHPPFAGAASGLGAALGLVMVDVYGRNDSLTLDTFSIAEGTLHENVITRGRNPDEKISEIATFTGQPAQITQGWKPLVVYGERAVGIIANDQVYQNSESNVSPATFPIPGWIHLATREWDEGRIVFSGEAAMCTAQLAGSQRRAMGMNSPQAPSNAQFCLNMLHWLSEILN